MKGTCRRLQNTLAEHGPAAFQADEAAQRHLEACDACFAVLESLSELDAAFDALPSRDAPDEVVERLLERGELSAKVSAPPRAPWKETIAGGLWQLFSPGRMRLKASVALVLLAALGLPFYLRSERDLQPQSELVHAQVRYSPPAAEGARGASGRAQSVPEAAQEEQKKGELQAFGYVGGGPGPDSNRVGQNPPRQGAGSTDDIVFSIPDAAVLPGPPAKRIIPPKAKRVPIPDAAPPQREPLRLDEPSFGVDDLSADEELDALHENLPAWVGTEAGVTFRGGSPRIESADSGPFDNDSDERQRVRDRLRQRLMELPRGLREPEDEAGNAPEGQAEGVDLRPVPRIGDDEDLDPRGLARRFLAERDALDVERFRPPIGYWSNTYVPGDPVLRYLQARLADRDRSALLAGAGGPLHEAARRTTQPFDPPTDAALAVVLHADRAAARGESRMLVQVGLVGTLAYGGRRPAMNVAVVLDLTGEAAPRTELAPQAELAPQTAATLRALVAAFGAARDVGDRFQLIVAGPGGGEALGPDDFKHGPLTVALRRLFPADGSAPEGDPVSLVNAMRMAVLTVGESDDPTAPLGSSAVVVVTPRPLGASTELLLELAYASAVDGIPVSAIGVGDGVNLPELEELALAGQGNRRLLREPAEAEALVDRELSAVGRAVARAVRLRIGLAAGVKLVEVVGARRYGEAGAERVRRAERSLDLRLVRNLGIAADRGDDEPGIQIVIPTFYAGDRHVVLLDVVAPGPGAIADVTVRFKDLVHVENGVARAHLDLPRGERIRGPLERNVLENLLAQRLRGALEEAGRLVVGGDRPSAAGVLTAHRQLLAGLGLEVQGFDKDSGLGRDVAMLDEYIQLLGSDASGGPDQLRYLSDSLRYAARLKVLPAPMVVGELR